MAQYAFEDRNEGPEAPTVIERMSRDLPLLNLDHEQATTNKSSLEDARLYRDERMSHFRSSMVMSSNVCLITRVANARLDNLQREFLDDFARQFMLYVKAFPILCSGQAPQCANRYVPAAELEGIVDDRL